MAQKFYAVKQGRKTGLFTTWDDCKAQVQGYSGAVYKSFPTLAEAQAYLWGTGGTAGNTGNQAEQKQEETSITEGTATEEVAPAAEQAQKKESSQPEIEIIVDRNGEKLTFNLSKGHVELSQISSFVDENNEKPTAYILLSSFLGKDTEKQFADLVKKYADEGLKHLTIDVRDNGGGSLDFALAMAEVFLEKGELICYYDDRTLEKPQPVYSTTEKVSFDSITILINEHSASAAELFVAAFRDYGLADIVGETTYGKGSVQSTIPLDSFGYSGYVRISYCVSTEMIQNSLASFEKLSKEYK